MASFAVVGATSWGATLAWLLHANGHEVALIARTAGEADMVRDLRAVPRLRELTLPAAVRINHEARASDGLVFAVPVQSLSATIGRLVGLRDAAVLSASKGIELASARRPSQLFIDAGWDVARVSVLSGPNLAREIVAGLPAAAVVASPDGREAARWQRALSGPAFRVYTADDVVGVEVAGAAKNVIAIAAGVASGCGFGANAIAALVTRGLAEITRLGVALGADTRTFLGLAGVGDLSATCFSPLSRNRRLGELLAGGRTAKDAIAEIGEAVEGAATAPVMVQLAHRHGIDVPLSEQVAALLAGRVDVAGAIAGLLGRGLTAETGVARPR